MSLAFHCDASVDTAAERARDSYAQATGRDGTNSLYLAIALVETDDHEVVAAMQTAGVDLDALREACAEFKEAEDPDSAMAVAAALAAADRRTAVTAGDLLRGALMSGRALSHALTVQDVARDAIISAIGQPRGAAEEPAERPGQVRDLTALAFGGSLRHMPDFDEDVAATIRMMALTSHNHPVLVGSSNLVKTAVAEGVARRVAAGECPPILRGRRVIQIDLAGIALNATEPTRALKEILTDSRTRGDIVVINDADVEFGNGMPDVKTLRTLLATPGSSGWRVIAGAGAAWPDQPLARDVFQRLPLSELDPSRATGLVASLAGGVARHHGVRISRHTAATAAALTHHEQPDHPIPEATVGALDAAAAIAAERGAASVSVADVRGALAAITGAAAEGLTTDAGAGFVKPLAGGSARHERAVATVYADQVSAALDTLAGPSATAVLTGSSALARRAVAHGIGRRMGEGSCAEALNGRRVIQVDVARMERQGASRERIEARLRGATSSAARTGDIVFIDGAEAELAGTLASQAVSGGARTIIGIRPDPDAGGQIAVTAQHPGLRFHTIDVPDPDLETAVALVRTAVRGTTFGGRLRVPPHAVQAAAELTGRLLSDRDIADTTLELVGMAGTLAGAARVELRHVRVAASKMSGVALGRLDSPTTSPVRDLTAMVRAGVVHPAPGFADEIDRALLIASRGSSPNPLLVGDSFYARQAIAEGMAARIAKGDCPPALRGHRVVQIDFMQMWTMDPQSVTHKFRAAVREAAKREDIVFVNDAFSPWVIAQLIGAQRGGSPCAIAGAGHAFVDNELSELEELARDFQAVTVRDLKRDEVLDILATENRNLRRHHHTRCNRRVLAAVADAAQRYLRERPVPEGARDLLDEAHAVAAQRGEGAIVTEDDMSKALSGMTGIPLKRLSMSEEAALAAFEESLPQRIHGQPEAVQAIIQGVRRARAGLGDPEKPAVSSAFIGPRGTGKTTLARLLGEFFFGDPRAVIEIDLTGYTEPHSISKLIGSPPGYVGYNEGGQLTNAVRRKPYSVVLIDEADKAHKDVVYGLMQAIGKGRIIDAQGRVADFRNTVLILAGNFGSHVVKLPPGFGMPRGGPQSRAEEQAAIREARKQVLRSWNDPQIVPVEFRDRFDSVVAFNYLGDTSLREVAMDRLRDLQTRALARRNTAIFFDMSVVQAILDVPHALDSGGRHIERVVNTLVSDPLQAEMARLNTGERATFHIFADEAGVHVQKRHRTANLASILRADRRGRLQDASAAAPVAALSVA